MNTKDSIKIIGNPVVRRYNSELKLVETRDIPNLVVTTGRNFTAARMVSNSTAIMSHMSVGSGTSAVNISQSALIAPLGGTRPVFSTAPVVSGSTITYSATFPPGNGTGAISEAGIFNAVAGGIMLCRTVFPVVNKESGDTVSITWTISVA
jgi:hypothetical protein